MNFLYVIWKSHEDRVLEPFEATRAQTREIYVSVLAVEKSTYLTVKKSAGWQISCF